MSSPWFPEPGSRWRLIGIYLLLWAMYAGSSGVIGWLGLPLRHRELLAADVWLFGATPAVAMQGRLPAWGTVALALAFELLTLWVIRDNLTLNVVMLVWPIDAIRVWQGGG